MIESVSMLHLIVRVSFEVGLVYKELVLTMVIRRDWAGFRAFTIATPAHYTTELSRHLKSCG